jgi:hypothetical protein
MIGVGATIPRLAVRGRGGEPLVPSPTFVAAGTRIANAAAIGGALSWPAGHQANDIGIFIHESAGEAIATPTGWTAINTPVGVGTPGTDGAAMLQMFWRRATSGTMGAVGTTTDSGARNWGQVVVFRGCIATGSPIEALASDTGASSTALVIPGGTTLGGGRMIVAAAAINAPNAINTANASAWSNTGLVSVTEMIDDTVTTNSTGGGVVAAYGAKNSAGAVGNTTATLANAAAQERVSFALIPA